MIRLTEISGQTLFIRPENIQTIRSTDEGSMIEYKIDAFTMSAFLKDPAEVVNRLVIGA